MAEKRNLAFTGDGPAGGVPDAVERAWAAACRTVLGGEIGNLESFAPWLREHMDAFSVRRSSRSGKTVRLAMPHYPENGRFITHD